MTDPENTRVLYQCSCGHQLELIEDIGGRCPNCDQIVSPKLLNHDLAMTMTMGTLPTGPAGGGTLYFGDHALETDQNVEDIEKSMAGKELGHFRIVDALGRGGMGQVYRALDTSLRRYVAVKVLRSGLKSGSKTSSDHEIELLLQEAVAQARVTHPNIVTIYYVGKHDDDPFLAMELINGKTISEIVAEGPMRYSQLHSIATQITSALKFSHELDIIHGDLKPSNIMVQPNGIAKLSDFGMARRASDTETRSVGGTPNYLAPELMRGEAPSIQSDMYALGVTLFEMSFGRLPVEVSGPTVEHWLECHTNDEIEFPTPWPESLAEEWRDILTTLLAKNPADRFDSWREVEDALARIEPAAPIPAKRSPRLVAAAIDFLLVALLIAPFQILRQVPPVEEFLSQSTLTAIFLISLEFGAIAAYTLLVVLWKQSPGRKLMHVRVVNEYGLKVTGQTMGTRSLLRMILMWFITLANISNQSEGFANLAANFVVTAGLVFTMVNVAFMLFYQGRRSLHDLITKTWVVLDTD